MNLKQEVIREFLKHIGDIVSVQNSLIVWSVAHPKRIEAKYMNAESLIWRDAGAYIYCFQIVATALDLNSCPVGSLGSPYISRLFGDEVFGAGGILIG